MPTPLNLFKLGDPPRTIDEWLELYAQDNDLAAEETWNPIARARFRGQAWAFRSALRLVRESIAAQTSAERRHFAAEMKRILD